MSTIELGPNPFVISGSHVVDLILRGVPLGTLNLPHHTEDKVDHMAVRDYKRVWAQLNCRQVDYSEQIARDDVTKAKSLPYAVSVVDDRLLPFDEREHADIDRAVMMQFLGSLMLERLPRKIKCGRRTVLGPH